MIKQSNFAIDSSNNLWQWGFNTNGTVGDSSITSKSSPIFIGGGYSEILESGTCIFAKKTDGSVWCWGSNIVGSLGLNNVANASSPVLFSSTNVWNKIKSGYNTTLGIKTDGTLWAWGRNDAGSLGKNDTIHRSSPIQVGTENTWTEIATSSSSSYGIKSDGTLWVWGAGNLGAWGNNATPPAARTPGRSSPVQLGTDTTWSKIDSLSPGCVALKTDGKVWIWGNAVNGMRGDNLASPAALSSPIQILGNFTYTKISTMPVAALIARRNDGTVWGLGQLNTGENTVSTSYSNPVQIAPQFYFDEIDFAGPSVGDSLIAIKTIAVSTTPIPITSTTTTSSTTPAPEEGFFVWGNNTDGVLGLGDTVHRSRGIQLGTDSQWNSNRINNLSSSGGNHTIISRWDRTLWACGNNTYGQIGDGTKYNRSSPVQITGSWINGVAGGTSTYAVAIDGSLWSWGRNIDGSLGNNQSSGDKPYPSRVGLDYTWSGNIGYLDAARHVAAIKQDGTLWLWGYNGVGQVGDGTIITRSSPVQVLGGGTTWTQVSVSGSNTSPYQTHTLAVKSNGTIWAWGANSTGQLGDNSIVSRSSPVQVVATGFKFAKAGLGFSLAIKSNGSLWAWGNYQYSGTFAVPANSFVNRSSPVQILGTTSWGTGIHSFDTKFISSIGLNNTTSQNLWNWGSGTDGALYQITNTNLIYAPLDLTQASSIPSGLHKTWSSAYQGYQRGAAGAISTVSAFGLVADWDPRNYANPFGTTTTPGVASGYFWTDASPYSNNCFMNLTIGSYGFIFDNRYSGFFRENTTDYYMNLPDGSQNYNRGITGLTIYGVGTKTFYYSDDTRIQSFEVWARAKPSNLNEPIASIGPLKLSLVYDQIVVQAGSTTILTASKKYSDWMFHQFTVVLSGSTLKLYVDGVLDTSVTYSGVLTTQSAKHTIGTTTSNIAKFRAWYGIARTDAEILTDYNSWKAIASYPTLTTRNAYTYTGSDQLWTCPAGVTTIYATAIGARGGNPVGFNSNVGGGNGGSIAGELTVVPGTTYRIVVGKVGTYTSGTAAPYGYAGSFTGSPPSSNTSAAYGGWGGGLGGIFTTSVSRANAILIAGGGGGAVGVTGRACTASTYSTFYTGDGSTGYGVGGSGIIIDGAGCLSTGLKNNGTLSSGGRATGSTAAGGAGGELVGGTSSGYVLYSDGVNSNAFVGGTGGAGYYGGGGAGVSCANTFASPSCPTLQSTRVSFIGAGGGSSYSAGTVNGHAGTNYGTAPWGNDAYVVICY